jgi:hypothetical protein
MMCKKGTGTLYRIVVRSDLSDRYAVAFEGIEMEAKGGRKVLTGRLRTCPTSTASSTA